MSQYVVWFDSSETGAPVLNNAAGSLIGVLDACLITGFNTKAVTITVAAGVATATANGHGFSGVYGKDVLIAGATPALLNGRKELTFVDTNTFRFAAPGVADAAATGTITAKRDPLGWVKQFTATNKAIYKRSDLTATSMMLRIDDTNAGVATATDARARMIESATDIDTITGLAPTEAQLSGGQYWNKGQSTVTAKQWSLVGDGKRFFLMTQTGGAVLPAVNGVTAAQFFGDFTSLKSGDAYNTLLAGSNAAWSGATNNAGQLGSSSGFAAGNATMVVARTYAQVGGAMLSNCSGFGSLISGAPSGAVPVYPSPIDSGLIVMPTFLLIEDNSVQAYPVRGVIPGLCQVIGRYPFNHYQIVDPVVSLPGRKLLALGWNVQSQVGMTLMDLTGPWA